MNPEKSKRLLVIMPAHNEQAHLRACLDSFVAQTRQPDQLLVVDDNSDDDTAEIISGYTAAHSWIKMARNPSTGGHKPGAKVVRCFNYGLQQCPEIWDFIGKFDADIVLPPDYFERILSAFAHDPKLGICSGLLYIEKNGNWKYESIAKTDHVRGPLKGYRRECFRSIGGLTESIGWDTADVLLARYHGFTVKTLPELKVHHLRPTGSGYSRENTRRQGEALYKLRYGWVLGGLASLKMAFNRNHFFAPLEHLQGALKAMRSGEPALLSPEEGRFARNWRWREIRKKLF